ncbi:MAG: putative porin [Acidobacteria bacterium]|nr:putative porin [Acidobacteriota bacterium]
MRPLFARTLLALAAFALHGLSDAAAQTPAPHGRTHAPAVAAATPEADSLDEVRRQLREQGAEIERLRATLAEQSRLLAELLARGERAGTTAAPKLGGAATSREASYTVDGVAATDALAPSAGQQTPGAAAQNPQTEQTEQAQGLKKTTEALSRRLGSITFSGDLRLRYETIFGQLNALANADNPAVLGNELSPRHRLRLRARLGLRGQIGKQFDWGLRLATGTTPDVTSTNQTLTDFFGRKSFALDQAYLSYRPAAVPGLRLQGGKFEIPWLFTEMTIDADVQPEGLNEALYGAQARARLELGPTTSLTLSAADLYYSGTQFITPAQFFGGQFQVPVTVTIPATATTPAQTVTALAAVPRELFVSGSGLGVTAASTNAVNRDGRLSSGFNLVDLIGRLELTRSKRWPVTLLFNFVTNTQARDVVAAGGPGGANRVLENNENRGYWAEAQVGKARERGDLLFNYTFIRIEKDAVLTPFNYSDLPQPSDVRAHRWVFTYAADPRVLLTFTGFVAGRPNGLPGAFGANPAGSLNRPTTRLQFDTVFRF